MTSDSSVVYVVDDDQSVRKALTRLLRSAGFEVVCFASAAQYLDQHDQSRVNCLLLDLAMPGLNGLELQQALTASGRERSIVFISGHGDVPKTVRAMKAGAIDFLTKPLDDAQLLGAVRSAIENDRRARDSRAQLDAIEQRIATLTPRERQVLEHLITGQLNKQIAADLGTGEKTIKVHRARVMSKMGVKSIAELVRLAEQAGIMPVTGRSQD